jgi:hypothetical protein
MTETPRTSGRRHVVLAVAYTVALFAVCSIPGHSIPFSALWSWDKLWHLLGFAMLIVLWRRAGYGGVAVAGGAFAYGVAIEIWQHVAPIGRFFDPLDILANAAGVVVGALVFEAAGRLTSRRERAVRPGDG